MITTDREPTFREMVDVLISHCDAVDTGDGCQMDKCKYADGTAARSFCCRVLYLHLPNWILANKDDLFFYCLDDLRFDKMIEWFEGDGSEKYLFAKRFSDGATNLPPFMQRNGDE